MSIFEFAFMQRALLAALVTGMAAPVVGIYIVQRRLALLGDGIGHVALTGVAIGLFANSVPSLPDVDPVLTAVVVSVAGAVAIELVRQKGRTSGDLALAMLFYGGIAGGVLVTGLAGASAATLNTYLFGSLTTVSGGDLVVVVVLAAVVLVLGLGLSRPLFAVSQDEEYARVIGLPVRTYNLMLAAMAAVTVTVAMRTVGLLLVSALMVVPVAASQQLTRSFRTTLFAAILIGVAASLSGVVTSYYIDTAPGATIVVLALLAFAAAWPIGTLVRNRRWSRAS